MVITKRKMRRVKTFMRRMEGILVVRRRKDDVWRSALSALVSYCSSRKVSEVLCEEVGRLTIFVMMSWHR